MTQEEYERKRKMRIVCCSKYWLDYSKIRAYCVRKYPNRINHYQIAYNHENEPRYYFFYNLTGKEYDDVIEYANNENI